MTGNSASPSLSYQIAAGTAVQGRSQHSDEDAPPSLLDDLMTVINYFRKH